MWGCRHPYFRRNLPMELICVMADGGAAAMHGAAERQSQSIDYLRHVLNQARTTEAAAPQPMSM